MSEQARSSAFANVPLVTFPLPRGNAVEIRLKSTVTTEEFEQLRRIFDLLGPSVIEEHGRPAGGSALELAQETQD